jgi:hypothetical protein
MYLALAQRFVRALPPGTPQGNTECCTTSRSRSPAWEPLTVSRPAAPIQEDN